MAGPGFWILLIASAVVVLLAAIDVIRLIRTRHAAQPVAERPGNDNRSMAAPADPGAEDGPLMPLLMSEEVAGVLRVWGVPGRAGYPTTNKLLS